MGAIDRAHAPAAEFLFEDKSTAEDLADHANPRSS
jgi:hypothetical protein